MSSKVVDLAEAVTLVPDGAHLALAGFAITRNPMAMVHELIRAERRHLTLTQVIAGLDADLLAGAGCLDRLVYSGGSLDRFGFLQSVNREVVEGRLRIEEYSSLALSLRLHAAGLGLDFVPTTSMSGSDLLPPLFSAGVARIVDDPFTQRPTLVLAPLHPDVAVIHADVADAEGNAALAGPTWTVRETALAARRVIVQCEQLVDVREIDPHLVLVPGIAVDAVVQVDRGAHPTAVFGRYDYDRPVLEEYVRAVAASPQGAQRFLDTYVRSVDGFLGYLGKVGAA